MTEAELDQLELKARTTIPEYGRIFTQCQSEMDTLNKCYQSGQKNCRDLETELSVCSHKAMCPTEFTELMKCFAEEGETSSKCQQNALQIQRCVETIAGRLYNEIENKVSKRSFFKLFYYVYTTSTD